MKVKEFIDENADNVATVVVNEYLINAVFGGDILPSEEEVVIGPVLTRKFRKALEELDARIQEMVCELEDKEVRRKCTLKSTT